MLSRTPEPELMDDPAQAAAYAAADFAASHGAIVTAMAERLRATPRRVLDLGCGPADFAVRVARAWPGCHVDGIDGSPVMLAEGRARLAREALTDRVQLNLCRLPDDRLPEARWDTVVSNSLLHHLSAPAVLWDTVRMAGEPGSVVFIADLMRPADARSAEGIVDRMAADEPAILRRDFLASLHAAFTVAEVRDQVRHAGLALRVEALDDHHLAAWGRIDP